MTPGWLRRPGRTEGLAYFVSGDLASPTALILHGGGAANSGRTRYLSEALRSIGVSTLAFDHVGHGETGGELEGSTLIERRLDAECVCRDVLGRRPDVIIGSSMGGHLALTLAGAWSPSAIILFCPAVYAAEAESVSFGPAFRAVLHQPESWRSSQALESISDYRGRLMVICGTNDDVIPREVIDAIDTAAAAAMSKRVLWLEGYGHPLHRLALEDDALRETLLDAVTSFLAPITETSRPRPG